MLNKIEMILVFLILSYPALPSIADIKSTKRSTPSYALIVGSNRPGPGQDPLSFAGDDALRIKTVLTELGGYEPSRVSLLSDPTELQLYEEIAQFKKRISEHEERGEQAVFLFYYSGHAKAQSLNLGSDEIQLSELRRRLEELPATVKFVVLDACQTGAISNIKGVEPTIDFSYNSVVQLNIEGTIVMASSAASELSQESPRLQGSFFTHNFVVGLRGAADANKDGRITLSEAYQYVYDHTLVATARTAVGKQHVTLETDLKGKGELVLSWPSEASAWLHLPVDLEGEVLVYRQRDNVVLAEINKASEDSFTLALSNDEYAALLRHGDKTEQCRLSEKTGDSKQQVLSDCHVIDSAGGEIKGKTPLVNSWQGRDKDDYILTPEIKDSFSDGKRVIVQIISVPPKSEPVSEKKEMLAVKGCRSCHGNGIDLTSKTEKQWEFFFRRNRHRRYADWDKHFSDKEVNRIFIYFINKIKKEKNLGIAGVK